MKTSWPISLPLVQSHWKGSLWSVHPVPAEQSFYQMSELSSLLLSGTKVLFRWSSGFFPSVLLWGTWETHSIAVINRNLYHTTTISKNLQFRREKNRCCILYLKQYYCMPIVNHVSYMTTLLLHIYDICFRVLNNYLRLDKMKIVFSFYICFIQTDLLFPSELLWTPGEKRGVLFLMCWNSWVHAHKEKRIHYAHVGCMNKKLLRTTQTYCSWHCPFSHLSIQQCHRDVAVDVAPPGAESGELHCGRRWEGRWQRGRLWGKLELIAAAEMPHLRCCSCVTPSEWQGHLVVVGDLCRQSNL